MNIYLHDCWGEGEGGGEGESEGEGERDGTDVYVGVDQ